MILTPYPIRNRVVGPSAMVTADWDTWFRDQLAAVNAAPFQVAHVFKVGQDAALSNQTAYQTPLRVEAVYRVSFTVRVTRAADVSSSIRVAIAWTAGGVGQVVSGTAQTGNTTATQTSSVLVIRADADTTIRYGTAYSSVGATTMAYTFDVCIEQLPDPPPIPVQP